MSRHTLSPAVAFRFLSADRIEIVPDPIRFGWQRSLTAPRTDHLVLTAFITPRTFEEAHAALAGAIAFSELVEIAERYLEIGVLSSDAALPETPGLRTLLREDVFADTGLYAALKHELRAGHACVIRDALHPDFAERVWQSLDSFDRWDSFRGYRSAFHSASGYAILDRSKLTPELIECERMLSSPHTRALISDLVGCDCDGDVVLDPKLYLPGDFFSPHADTNDDRVATFTWQLTRDWLPRWGGHFVWCDPVTNFSPTFNTLILFKATATGYHMVTPVSPQARGKRLAVSAWWTSRKGTPKVHETSSDWYRGPVRSIAANVFAVG
jgi:hypothetical protein